jgi:hypothetical protein
LSFFVASGAIHSQPRTVGLGNHRTARMYPADLQVRWKKWHGIQCKGKDVGYASKLTKQEIEKEAQKAKGFRPALTHWIVATTAPKDSELEQFARELTVEHEAVRLFDQSVPNTSGA